MAKHAEFINGYLNAASLTAAYQNVLVTTEDLDNIFISNSSDNNIWLSLPQENGSSEVLLPAGCSFAYDAWANNRRISAGVIMAKHAGIVPSEGVISIIGVA